MKKDHIMQTIHLQIEDSKLDAFLTVIDNLKDGMVKSIVIDNVSYKDINEYLSTKKFEQDKQNFQNTLNDLESGKVTPLSHASVWNAIETHVKVS